VPQHQHYKNWFEGLTPAGWTSIERARRSKEIALQRSLSQSPPIQAVPQQQQPQPQQPDVVPEEPPLFRPPSAYVQEFLDRYKPTNNNNNHDPDISWEHFDFDWTKCVHYIRTAILKDNGIPVRRWYVGVAGDPQHRWHCQPHGHKHTPWATKMHVWTLAWSIGVYETYFIHVCHAHHPSSMMNISRRGGGGVRASKLNFLYIITG